MGSPRSIRARARETARRLAKEYPGEPGELIALRYEGPFQLLVATVLSAQTTDECVNKVTQALFSAWPTPEDLAGADAAALEAVIRPCGFFRIKARRLKDLAQALVERSGGEVPSSMDELTTLPGVGRKTANVVLSVGMGLPGLAVDTHVRRVSRRLGLTANTDPDKIEQDLCALLPRGEWGAFSLRMILHGRRVCLARRRLCEVCVLEEFCPSSTLRPRPKDLAGA